MVSEVKKEPTPDKMASSSRKLQHAERGLERGQAQQTLCFQGSCEELKGWVFDSTDSGGADKFNTVQEEIVQYILIKFTYGTELKSSIDKLKKITLAKPSTPAETAAQLDKDIYKEEVREYVQERQALEMVTKQA
eukprot:13580957-Ditylum_brightwellii.AAC.1